MNRYLPSWMQVFKQAKHENPTLKSQMRKMVIMNLIADAINGVIWFVVALFFIRLLSGRDWR